MAIGPDPHKKMKLLLQNGDVSLTSVIKADQPAQTNRALKFWVVQLARGY
jgi:hypothetical protein